MAITLDEAVKKSIKNYFKGKSPEKSSGVSKLKYTKKYFDRFEEAEFGSKLDYLKGKK